MPTSTLVPLVGGAIAIVVGIVLIVFRKSIAAINARVQREAMGKVGEQVASSSTPLWVAVPGIVFIAIGVFAIFFAFS